MKQVTDKLKIESINWLLLPLTIHNHISNKEDILHKNRHSRRRQNHIPVSININTHMRECLPKDATLSSKTKTYSKEKKRETEACLDLTKCLTELYIKRASTTRRNAMKETIRT